jgi:hypothetical protein
VPVGRWSELVGVAKQHLLAGALFEAIRDHGELLGVPDAVAFDLARAHRETRFENLRFKHQLRTVVSALNQVDVVPLILKGGAFLLDGSSGDLGARGMVDIDLLVRPNEFDGSQAAIAALGYQPKDPLHASPHAVNLVCETGAGGGLDLHRDLGSPALMGVLPTSEAIARSVPRTLEGLRYATMSPTDTVIHNVAHAQLQTLEHATAAVPLRQLHTYANYVTQNRDTVDWNEVIDRFRMAGRRASLDAHAELVSRLFGIVTPVASTLRARLHYERCMVTFVSPVLSELPRNLYFAFEAPYMRRRYGSGPMTMLRIRHARRLWKDHHALVVDQALARHTQ